MPASTRTHQAERFDRFQRQFARTRHRRDFDDFKMGLEALLARASNPPAPPPQPAPAVPRKPDQGAFDQQMKDLLVRVQGRPLPRTDPVRVQGHPLPPADPDDAGPAESVWWSPRAVLGYRTWQVIDDQLHGARMPWSIPQQTARCLHRWTSNRQVPHDAGDCGNPPCGIYAFKDIQRVRALIEPWFEQGPLTVAVGVVALSGRVIEHDRGYRAEHAEVAALSLISGTKRAAAAIWVEGPIDLTEMFESLRRFLEANRSGALIGSDTFNVVFERLAAHAKALDRA